MQMLLMQIVHVLLFFVGPVNFTHITQDYLTGKSLGKSYDYSKPTEGLYSLNCTCELETQ